MKSFAGFRVTFRQIVGMSLVLAVVAAAQNRVPKDTVQFDESFDPSTLVEPELKWPVILHPGETLPDRGEGPPTDTNEEGYRIQVLSTPDYATADSLMGELVPVFHGEVYLTFDPPNYKVRVGNFKFRSRAEEAQERLGRMGFRSAWIIRTQIVVSP